MHLEPAYRQSRVKLRHEGFSLLFIPAMHKSIVSISTPWKVRMRPRHPEIKCIVHEEIRQDWADYSPYAKGNFSFERVICDWRTRVAVLDLRLKK
jgi:hypothetical protein